MELGRLFFSASLEKPMKSVSFVNGGDGLFSEKIFSLLIFRLSLQIGHHHGLLGVGLIPDQTQFGEILSSFN